MQDRFVWSHALEDLRELFPFSSPANIGQMTAIEMRLTCLRIAQIFKRWMNGNAPSHVVYSARTSTPMRDIQLLPGGKHLLVMARDGTLTFHYISSSTLPAVTIQNGDLYTAGGAVNDHAGFCLQTIVTSMNTAFVVYSFHSNMYVVFIVDDRRS